MSRGSLTAELREALGEDGLRRLVQHYGGLRLQVPLKRPTAKLIDELGPQTAHALWEAFRAIRIVVPTLRADDRAQQLAIRDAAVKARRAARVPVNVVAREFGLTYRQVLRICSANRVGNRRLKKRCLECERRSSR